MAIATVTDLKTRYTEFATVENDTVSAFLSDSSTFVSGWGDDEALGSIYYAAHHMSLAGYGGASAVTSAPAGVKSIASGSHKTEFFENTDATTAFGYGATRYGTLFEELQERYKTRVLFVL